MKEKEPIRMETGVERQGIEIIPVNIGEMRVEEASPLLRRAASRIEIVRPKNETWQGIKENLEGTAAWIEAKKIKAKALNTVAGVSLVASMVSACTPRNIEAAPPLEATPTTQPLNRETQVAPAPTQEYEARPISNVFVLDEAALFEANKDIEGEFQKFKESFLAEHSGTMPENVRLTATGMLTDYSDEEGMTLHPLFGVESDNPEVASSLSMLIGITTGTEIEYKLIPLERGEWQDEQGNVWITLAVTRDTRSETPLPDPLEVFAIQQDQLTSPDALVYWSPSGSALQRETSYPVKVLTAINISSPRIPEIEILETYIVQPGDTIESIAQKYGLTPQELMAANPERNWLSWSTGIINKELKIPSPDIKTTISLNYQKNLEDAPEIDNLEKISDPDRIFVFYRNLNGEITRVFDPDSEEVYGYSTSNLGNIILTSESVNDTYGRILPLTGSRGNIDETIRVWRSYHLNNGNPFGITESTPIQIEFRYPNSDSPWPIRRLVNYGGGSYSGAWAGWAETGVFRIVIYYDYSLFRASPNLGLGIGLRGTLPQYLEWRGSFVSEARKGTVEYSLQVALNGPPPYNQDLVNSPIAFDFENWH